MDELVELVKILGPAVGGIVVTNIIWAKLLGRFVEANERTTAVLHELKGCIQVCIKKGGS